MITLENQIEYVKNKIAFLDDEPNLLYKDKKIDMYEAILDSLKSYNDLQSGNVTENKLERTAS